MCSPKNLYRVGELFFLKDSEFKTLIVNTKALTIFGNFLNQ